MGLEATFKLLSVAIHKLHDALDGLHLNVGDKPPNDDAALVDGLDNAVLDMMGTLHEMRASAAKAQKAVSHPVDLESARHELTQCQERFHSIEQQVASELVSYERLKELARLGKDRRAWLPWTNSIRQGIEQCRGPMEEASTALAACWQELAERLGSVNISMKAVNVGQQITVPRAKLEDVEVEGVT